MKTAHTALSITALLQTNNKAVERAMVFLYERQTSDEQNSSTTRHRNYCGFSASNASKGSYYARWVQSGKRLTGTHLENARRIACEHVEQLVCEANMPKPPKAAEAQKAEAVAKTTVLAVVPSMTEEGKTYEIRRTAANIIQCSCPAWTHQHVSEDRRTCKHLKSWAANQLCGRTAPVISKSEAASLLGTSRSKQEVAKEARNAYYVAKRSEVEQP